MKFLPQHNLFFVHIPKCAGISVRRALDATGAARFSPMARDLGLTEREAQHVTEAGVGFTHPGLGTFHPAHVPLAHLRARMPATWAALRGADSFALTRDPRARFLSALMQRLKEFRGAGAIRADDPIVAREAAAVCDWLADRDVFGDLDHIHFTRQVDYVDLDGTRIVGAVFPVEGVAALGRWIRDRSGLALSFPHDHARRQPRRGARWVQPVARFAGRRLMPRRLKQALHPLWLSSGVFADAARTYDAVDLGADVERFIAAYYAADAALHREAQARA